MDDLERIKELEWQLQRAEDRLGQLIHRVEDAIRLFQGLASLCEREEQKTVLPEIASHYRGRAQCYRLAAKWLQEDLEKTLERREAVGSVSSAF